LVISAAALVGSLAWAGHAAGGIGVEATVHPIADVLHLVAAAAWVGALIPLALLLSTVTQEAASLAIARTATLHFSTLGIASVATLLATGLINTWYLAGSVPALVGTDYGRLLLAKIAVFLCMVAIAAFNLLRLTPRIVKIANVTAAQHALGQLRRNAAIETVAGAIVLTIVGVLGTLPPAIHAAHHHPVYGAVPADAAFQHIHTDQGMADVTIMPGRVGTARATIRLWTEDFEPLAAKEVTLTVTPPAAGSKPTTRVASQDSDGAWQVDGIELSQPGNWTVTVGALLGPHKHILLDAPIVIESK
jgi:putative copper resistance protein D